VELSERRIVGSIILLAGVTLLIVALQPDQLARIVEMMGKVFEPALAGLP
jgi:hypothetical protein